VNTKQRIASRGSHEASELRALIGDDHHRTLVSVMERIFPSDVLGPGAVDLGADRFVLRLLREDADLRLQYSTVLAEITNTAARLHGRSFVQCTAGEQDEVLCLFDGDAAASSAISPESRALFGVLVAHTLQGVFADPIHGGNAEARSWVMLGYPRSPIAFAPRHVQGGR
jgi:gluconate 2-dehydrogenase gamma chain